ncbi:MAG: hypothetical protein DME19_06600 [Verrucomicrobia bacterium]|nr:MAG: hypothetical protein DME19_06600 [Verrucomicrobiota bacterium]
MQMTRLLVLIFVGVVAVFCVARFAVPAIYPDQPRVRTRFSTGTAMPGAPARQGLHFGAATAASGEQTRYVYVRISSTVWVLEFITPSQ